MAKRISKTAAAATGGAPPKKKSSAFTKPAGKVQAKTGGVKALPKEDSEEPEKRHPGGVRPYTPKERAKKYDIKPKGQIPTRKSPRGQPAET